MINFTTPTEVQKTTETNWLSFSKIIEIRKPYDDRKFFVFDVRVLSQIMESIKIINENEIQYTLSYLNKTQTFSCSDGSLSWIVVSLPNGKNGFYWWCSKKLWLFKVFYNQIIIDGNRK